MADEKSGFPANKETGTSPPPYPGNQQITTGGVQPQSYVAPYPQGNASYTAAQPGYTPNVVTVQPYPQRVAIVTGPRPTNWMVPSILACIFCCWPIGIFAIISASNANTAADRGDTITAKSKAKTARNLVIAAVVCGIIIIVAVSVYRMKNSDSPYGSTYRRDYT